VTAADEQLLLDTPAARPCTHRRAHSHATLQRYKQDRCRCLPCRTANAAYERRRRESHDGAYGSWSAFADTAPVRAHLLELLAAGMTVPGIAARAQLDRYTVRRVLDPDTRRLRQGTAAALQAIQAGQRRPPNQAGLWGDP
jgi:hypothetical protein